jgi:hypothetical protein
MTATIPRHTAWREHRPAGEDGPVLPPRLADGIELIGEYEGSGFKTAPYIARRSNGQMIQLTRLLYLVAEQADGERGDDAIADLVSERYGKRVSADNVAHLVDTKLRPLGVLTAPDGSSPEVAKADQLLALKFKTAVVPARLVRTVCTVFKPLFLPPPGIRCSCSSTRSVPPGPTPSPSTSSPACCRRSSCSSHRSG